MVQEDQTVTFQPIYEGYQPWFAKLFVFYLLVVLIVSLLRSFRFVWVLLKLRKGKELSEPAFEEVWTNCWRKIDSSKQLAGLTVLVSVLNLSWWTADILIGVRMEKTPNLAYILPAIGDALTAFTFGISVCVAIFGGSMWAQLVLNRRKAAFLTKK